MWNPFSGAGDAGGAGDGDTGQFAVAEVTPFYQWFLDIGVGSNISYAQCKEIYVYHPLGAKMVDAPINLAFSQDRVVKGVPDAVRNRFEKVWAESHAMNRIIDTVRQGRIYGVATCVEIEPGIYSVFDPLVTAGSFAQNLERLSPNFLKLDHATVDGRTFTAKDGVIFQNETPLYLQWSAASYGYTGRSVYLRALFPLKTFLQSMLGNAYVIQKAGVLVAKVTMLQSAITKIFSSAVAFKRRLLQMAGIGNVISIGDTDSIDTLDVQHSAEAIAASRENVLENIASAADMPAILLKNEVLNQGFGEGTEDAKAIANYVDRFRKSVEPLFEWFIPRIQDAAWTPEFYEAFQNDNQEWMEISYEQAFYMWQKDFIYEWPNLLTEPDSEKIKVPQARFESLEKVFNLLNATVSPEDRKELVRWVTETINSEGMRELFPEPLYLELDGDFDAPQPTELKARISDREEDEPVGNVAGEPEDEGIRRVK